MPAPGAARSHRSEPGAPAAVLRPSLAPWRAMSGFSPVAEALLHRQDAREGLGAPRMPGMPCGAFYGAHP